MAPNDDVERPRASSGAERQKSIVSMTEFDGMDEYTALQKYILFYRDAKVNPHATPTVKVKKWWQFWKSGATTAAPVADAGAVPDDCKSSFHRSAIHPLPFPLLPHARLATAIAHPPHLHARTHHSPATCLLRLLGNTHSPFVVVEQQRPQCGRWRCGMVQAQARASCPASSARGGKAQWRIHARRLHQTIRYCPPQPRPAKHAQKKDILANIASQSSTLSFALVCPRTRSRSAASAMASTKSPARRPTFSSSSLVTSPVLFSTVSTRPILAQTLF